MYRMSTRYIGLLREAHVYNLGFTSPIIIIPLFRFRGAIKPRYSQRSGSQNQIRFGKPNIWVAAIMHKSILEHV
jgi:hypothetical protein